MKPLDYTLKKIVMKSSYATKTARKHLFHSLTPFRGWLFSYKKEFLRADIIAGLTVAGILVPQAMAYALLAGLPPQMGLYAAILASVVGVLWGSSAHVATGPVAIVSLLSLTTLMSLATPGSPEFIALAISLAIAVGLVQLSLGLFRFGFIMRLIPHTVLVGFSSAAAIIIASTQVPSLFGYSITQKEQVFQTFIELVKHAPSLHTLTAFIGILALIVIASVKRKHPTFPISLVVLAVSIIASYSLDLAGKGVAIIGVIPSHMPTPSFEGVSVGVVFSLLGSAFIIALVGFMETYAVAKAVSRKTKQKISSNQELVGQGLSNLASGIFGGYAVAGSFSRTAVNFDAGAKTQMAGIVVGIATLASLIFLTPFLFFLPKAILAAIVIAAVIQIVDPERFREAFRISKTDGIVAIATFATAFLLKPDDAVLVGVILALALFLHRTMWANVSEEGFDKQWGDILRRAGTKDEIELVKGMVIVRIDMSIFYANVEHVVEEMKLVYQKRKKEAPVRFFVMDFAGVNYLDLTALETLGEFLNELRAEGVIIHSIYTKTSQRTVLQRAHDIVGVIHFTHNIQELQQAFKDQKDLVTPKA